jgi:hypothetical protein
MISSDHRKKGFWSLNFRHLTVMGLLFGLLLFIPLVSQTTTNTVLLAALTLSAWLVGEWNRRLFLAIAFLGILGICLSVADRLFPEIWGTFVGRPLGYLFVIILLALLIFCAGNILAALLRATRVTADEVVGGLNFYLIIGFIWANIYELLVLLNPNSFNINLTGDELFDKLVYFSFVTLTTLGYGDVTPQSAMAEVFVSVQAIIGHIYVPVVVSYLLSLFVSQRLNAKKQESE